MKILHFIWSLSTGGAENLAVDLANAQAKDHDVTMMVGNDLVDKAVKERLSDRVKFSGVGRPERSRNPYWLTKLLIQIWLIKPDVIHVHNCNLIEVRQLIPFPMVLTVHATNERLTKNVEQFAAVCCISQAVLKDVRNRYPVLKPMQIDNGIEVAAVRTKGRSRRSGIHIVQVSRLDHTTKGQDLLIEAVAIIKQDLGVQKLQMDFIGDGPSRGYLEDLAKTQGVANECRFLGAMTRGEIYESLHEYDLLVQPSRYEGFGLTVAEGLAAKIPVLVSDIEGPMEVIAQGAHGYSFRSGEVASLVEAIRLALNDIDTPKMAAAASNAWDYVREKYDVSLSAARYIKVYEAAKSQ